jgi:pyruvate dehydrogenase E2 component (dihydrolipoamide acetyltransferase)
MSNTRRPLPVKENIPLNRLGKAMAKGMKASVETLALSQVSRELDLTGLQALRREKSTGGDKLSLNTLLMGAVARTLPNHKLLNAQLVENEVIVYAPINLGMAVATPLGLIVVVIQGADQLSIEAMGERIDALVERARLGKLELPDIEGGTFTVSNLGMYGVDSGFALPRPPESAVLLLGAVRPRPALVDGAFTARETCWAALTYDHRFIDGAIAGTFLQDLAGLLGEPEKLLA